MGFMEQLGGSLIKMIVFGVILSIGGAVAYFFLFGKR